MKIRRAICQIVTDKAHAISIPSENSSCAHATKPTAPSTTTPQLAQRALINSLSKAVARYVKKDGTLELHAFSANSDATNQKTAKSV